MKLINYNFTIFLKYKFFLIFKDKLCLHMFLITQLIYLKLIAKL